MPMLLGDFPQRNVAVVLSHLEHVLPAESPQSDPE